MSIKKISASLILMALSATAFAEPACNATEFWVCTYTCSNIKYETAGGTKADAYIKLVDYLGRQENYQRWNCDFLKPEHTQCVKVF